MAMKWRNNINMDDRMTKHGTTKNTETAIYFTLRNHKMTID